MPKLNENYQNLKESYLFVEIAHRVSKYAEANPDKKIIRARHRRCHSFRWNRWLRKGFNEGVCHDFHRNFQRLRAGTGV